MIVLAVFALGLLLIGIAADLLQPDERAERGPSTAEGLLFALCLISVLASCARERHEADREG